MEPVTILRWPDDAATRAELARAGRARLLLVAPDDPPPVAEDPLEDWVRTTAAEHDVSARLAGLRRRFELATRSVPRLDADGVIRFRDRMTTLPPVEARIAGALLRRFGAVVSRQELTAAGWPDGDPGRNALDVHVLRLRRRLAPVRLGIRTVRSRGYLLQAASSGS